MFGIGKQKPLVSALGMSMKKLNEDPIDAKKAHRVHLNSLIAQYAEDVQNGKASGIRNAKELTEIIKMDLLLLGEVTERTEVNETESDKRVKDIAAMLSKGISPALEGLPMDASSATPEQLLEEAMNKMNQYNDDQHR